MKHKTRAEAAHLEHVASLGCAICRHVLNAGYVPCEVHHIGDTSERSHWLTVGLCPEHHRGATGFHGAGERAFNRIYKTSEIQLLALTIADLARERIAVNAD